jgi:hypothetical protein
MKTKFQFSSLDIALLITNTVAFSGCSVLLLFGRASGPLVLLTIGAFWMLVGNLGRAYYRARQAEKSFAATKER